MNTQKSDDLMMATLVKRTLDSFKGVELTEDTIEEISVKVSQNIQSKVCEVSKHYNRDTFIAFDKEGGTMVVLEQDQKLEILGEV